MFNLDLSGANSYYVTSGQTTLTLQNKETVYHKCDTVICETENNPVCTNKVHNYDCVFHASEFLMRKPLSLFADILRFFVKNISINIPRSRKKETLKIEKKKKKKKKKKYNL